MSCETARRLIETNDPELERHRMNCPSCILSEQAHYYEAPASLADRIRGSLRREPRPRAIWRELAIAASLLLVVSAGWNLVLLRSREAPAERIAEDVLSAHLRSLAGAHLLDVPSSDQHTVKPWFNGKLDFAPPVIETPGFPLLGGRLEYLEGHPAAALIYGRRNHTINVFVWPAAAAPSLTESRNGYHLRSWWANGMAFWAVSDLNDAELDLFVALYRKG